MPTCKECKFYKPVDDSISQSTTAKAVASATRCQATESQVSVLPARSYLNSVHVVPAPSKGVRIVQRDAMICFGTGGGHST